MLKKIFPQSVIGIDVRSNKLHLIQARKHSQKIIIEKIITQELPVAVVADDQIIEWKLLQAALQAVVVQHHLAGSVILGIPAKLAFMHTFEAPAGLRTHEIQAAIQQDLQIRLPSIKETLRVDFAVSPKSIQNTISICYAAAKQTYVAAYVNCIQAIGLKVQAVDVEDCALIRAFCPMTKVSKGIHGIFCLRETEICFILFTAYEILMKQCWKITAVADFQSSLDYKLNEFKQQYPQLESLSFAAPDSVFHSFIKQRCQNWVKEIKLMEGFKHLQFAQTDHQQILNNNFSHWVISCGLTLRGFV